MSLDKWIKTDKKKEKKNEDKKKKKPLKKKPKSESTSTDIKTTTIDETPSKTLTKYILICPKKSCGYQKTLRKKQLTDKDRICPRCKGNMKAKKG